MSKKKIYDVVYPAKLTTPQYTHAKKKGAKRGTSAAEVIRYLLDQDMATEKQVKELSRNAS